MNKVQSAAISVAIVLLTLGFGAAGIAKLMGVEMVHHSFSVMGLPVWFGYFIGVCEIAGAIGILIRKFSSIAASGLLSIMLGALGYHLTFDPIAAAVPASILAVLSTGVIFARKADSAWVPGALIPSALREAA